MSAAGAVPRDHGPVSSASQAGISRPTTPGTARFDADAPGAAVRPATRAAGRAWSQARSGGLVLLLVLAGLLLVPRPTSSSQPAVDVAARAAAAASAFPLTPAVPQGLPVTWVPTEAGLQHARAGVLTWRITYRTPSGAWVGVRQGAGPNRSWEDLQVINGIPTRRYELDGHTWVQRDRGDRLMRNLVAHSAGLTTVVSTDGSQAELLRVIEALPLDTLGTPLHEGWAAALPEATP